MVALEKFNSLQAEMDKLFDNNDTISEQLDTLRTRVDKIERKIHSSESITHYVSHPYTEWVSILEMGLDGNDVSLCKFNIKSPTQGWEYIIDLAIDYKSDNLVNIVQVTSIVSNTTFNRSLLAKNIYAADEINNINKGLLSFRALYNNINNTESGITLQVKITEYIAPEDTLVVRIVDGTSGMKILPTAKAFPRGIKLPDGSDWNTLDKYRFVVAPDNTISYWIGSVNLANFTAMTHEMTSCITGVTISISQIRAVVLTIYDTEASVSSHRTINVPLPDELIVANTYVDDDGCLLTITIVDMDGEIVLSMLTGVSDDDNFDISRYVLTHIEFITQ